MAKLKKIIEPTKFVHIIEQPIIGIQITFEHDYNTNIPIPVGLMLYSYPSKTFMIMTQKMHGGFFKQIVDNALASQEVQDRIKALKNDTFIIPDRDIEYGDLRLEQIQDEAKQISNHFESELFINQ